MTNDEKKLARAIARNRTNEAIKEIEKLEKEIESATGKHWWFLAAAINTDRKELGLEPIY